MVLAYKDNNNNKKKPITAQIFILLIVKRKFFFIFHFITRTLKMLFKLKIKIIYY